MHGLTITHTYSTYYTSQSVIWQIFHEQANLFSLVKGVKIKPDSVISYHVTLVYSMLNIITTVVCSIVGNSWCKVACTKYKLGWLL